jgi:hypothetical protein
MFETCDYESRSVEESEYENLPTKTMGKSVNKKKNCNKSNRAKTVARKILIYQENAICQTSRIKIF